MTDMDTKRARGKCIANALVCQLCWIFLFNNLGVAAFFWSITQKFVIVTCNVFGGTEESLSLSGYGKKYLFSLSSVRPRISVGGGGSSISKRLEILTWLQHLWEMAPGVWSGNEHDDVRETYQVKVVIQTNLNANISKTVTGRGRAPSRCRKPP